MVDTEREGKEAASGTGWKIGGWRLVETGGSHGELDGEG